METCKSNEDVNMSNVSSSPDNEDQEQAKKGTQSPPSLMSMRPPMPKKRQTGYPKTSNDMSRRTSEVWNHFTPLRDCDPEFPRAACNYCGRQYAVHPRRNGTSSCWNHLENQCKKNPYREVLKKQKLSNSQPAEVVGSMAALEFDPEAIRQALVEMIIIDELPFGAVERKGFKEFCRVSIPKFDLPSHETIARDVIELYMDEKKALKEALLCSKHRVCLTSDCWTSVQNNNYMVLTSHYVDGDWRLQQRILNVCEVPNRKGDTIGRTIEGCLREWGINGVFTITVDNTDSNDTAIMWLTNRFKTWNGFVLGGEFLHVRCAVHILNLVVNDGLKNVHRSIKHIRSAVRYVRSSPQRLQKFKECAKHENIEYQGLVYLDVSSRWNSTYLMLDAAVKFQKAFDRMGFFDDEYLNYFVNGDEDDMCPPTDDDWKNAAVSVNILKIFYNATLNLSDSLHVTADRHVHDLYDIQSKLVKLIASEDLLLKRMATNMKTKFDKYWGNVEKMNKLIFIAVVLDPRFKLKYLSFMFSRTYEPEVAERLVQGIKDALTKIYEFYDKDYKAESQKTNSSTCTSQSESMTNTELLFLQSLEEENSLRFQSEVDQYLSEPIDSAIMENTKDFDILLWWRSNAGRFKVLSQIARDVLAMQVSAVPTESAFSTRARMLDDFRSFLRPKIVEAVICVQSWLQANNSNFREETFDQDLANIMDDLHINDNLETELLVEKSSTDTSVYSKT